MKKAFLHIDVSMQFLISYLLRKSRPMREVCAALGQTSFYCPRGGVMKRLFAAVLLVFWIPLALFAVDMSWKRSLQKGSSEELVKVYKDLTEPRPQWKIETAGLTINRPAFKMVLGKGTSYADGSQNGAIRPLYYQGSGSISFEVSNRIERAHLKLFIGKESLHEQPVSSVLVLPLGVCADLPKIPEGPLSIGGRGEYAHFKNALHAGGMNWLASVLNGTLHGPQDIAILFRMDGDVWAYVLDSTDEEEVSLAVWAILRTLNPGGGTVQSVFT